MIPPRYPHPDSTVLHPPSGTATIIGGVAFILATLALLVALSYPVYAAAFVGATGIAAALARLSGPAVGRRLHGRMTELSVPGLGIVQIRITAR